MRDQLALLAKAGFSQSVYAGKTDTKTSDYTVGALFMAINGSSD